MSSRLTTVEWKNNSLILIDQRALPQRFETLEITSLPELVEAIQTLAVRGAPALGAAGAYGVALVLRDCRDAVAFEHRIRLLREARPTAVNLGWGVARVVRSVSPHVAAGRWDLAYEDAVREAGIIATEDVAANAAIAEHGHMLIPDGAGVLTHCNTGDLATVSGGTALGVIRRAHELGRKVHVFADETRPRFQGLRLTSWELGREGIPVTVIPDGAAAYLMGLGRVHLVIVGADRIAANGDTANKVGTYSLAVAAKAHAIPFYVAAPTTTVDLDCPDGSAIPIEERDASEVLHPAGLNEAPPGVDVLNYAFDVTPADLITGIITETGILRPDYRRSIAEALVKERT